MKEIIISAPFSNILPNSKRYTRIISRRNLKKLPNKKIIASIKWKNYVSFIEDLNILVKKDKLLGVELDFSCSEVSVEFLNKAILEKAKIWFGIVIVKVHEKFNDIKSLVALGVEYLNISTSFKKFKTKNLYLEDLLKVSLLRSKHKSLKIMGGGGGIYSISGFYQYKLAGANHISLSTIFFHPIKLIKFILKLKKLR